jgi:hypothetical protein
LGKSRREFRWKSIAMVRVKCSLSYILPCFAERAASIALPKYWK